MTRIVDPVPRTRYPQLTQGTGHARQAANRVRANTVLSTRAGSIDSSGVIYGCYTAKAVNGSNALVLQGTGTSTE